MLTCVALDEESLLGMYISTDENDVYVLDWRCVEEGLTFLDCCLVRIQ